MEEDFLCPKCKQTLVMKSKGYSCHNCECFYPLHDGYVDFIGDVEFYAGEVSQNESQKLINEIDSRGFDEGLSGFLKKYPDLRNYITDFKRTDWLSHCLGKNNLRCLDIGSGLGNISHLLSYNYQKVYSLEAVKERIEFQKRRYKNSNRTNITIVRGNALELPFPDNFFDLVICNGLLEWVGMMNTDLPPRDTQLSFLREVKRVLSKNGCLYIGIENRFGIQFIMGARDHSGLRYTSLLPRKIANFFVRRFSHAGGIYGDKSKKKKEKKGYYTYTYSVWGYRSLFKQAGFHSKDYWVHPSYNEPLFSGKLDDKIGAKSFLINFKSTFNRFKIPISIITKLDKSILGFILSLFSSNFLFYCYKNDCQESVEEIASRNADLQNFTTIGTGNNILFLMYTKDGNPAKVVRLKRFGGDLPDTLITHDKTRPSSNTIERMWREDWISAMPVNPLNITEMKASVDWLIDFQTKNSPRTMTKDDKILDVNKIRKRISEIPDLDNPRYKKLIERYQTYLESIQINKTEEHGDFWHGNILIDSALHKIWVIDWEYYREEGNPLFDFVFLLLNAIKFASKNPEEIVAHLNGNGKFMPILIELKNKINKFLGFELNLDILFPYVLLCFVIRKQLESGPHNKQVIFYKKLLDSLSSK